MRTIFRVSALAGLVLVGGAGAADARLGALYVPNGEIKPEVGGCSKKDCTYNVYVTVDGSGHCTAYVPSVVRMKKSDKGRPAKLTFQLVGADEDGEKELKNGREPTKTVDLAVDSFEFPEWQGVISLAANDNHHLACGKPDAHGKRNGRFGDGCQRDRGDAKKYTVMHQNPGGGAEDPYVAIVLYTAHKADPPALCAASDPKMISD